MSLHWTSLHCDSAEQYLALCGRVSIVAFAHQQPGGGDTPGVAVAPVALAGAIIPGVARFIVVLSAQADVFGVGATVIVGSRLVATSCVISGWIVPGGGLYVVKEGAKTTVRQINFVGNNSAGGNSAP
jgi:hypothetical protein